MNAEIKKIASLLEKNGVPFSLVFHHRWRLYYPSEQAPVCVVLPTRTGLSMHGLFPPEENNGMAYAENITAQDAAEKIMQDKKKGLAPKGKAKIKSQYLQ